MIYMWRADLNALFFRNAHLFISPYSETSHSSDISAELKYQLHCDSLFERATSISVYFAELFRMFCMKLSKV